jgi:hypothetical protein
MTEAVPPAAAPPPSLFSRAVGIVTSPKATFEKIVPVPRPFGILFICAVLMGIAIALPQFTEKGRQVIMQAQMQAAQSRGGMSPEAQARMESFSAYIPYFTLVSFLIFVPIVTMFLSALYWGIFNVALGGTASFKQVLSISAHSQVIPTLGVLVGIPFMLASPTTSMGGPFNLGALVPTLEEGSRLAKFLGNISVFSLWSVFVSAIGFGVLYRRKTTGIFIVLLVVYLAFAYLGSLFGRG